MAIILRGGECTPNEVDKTVELVYGLPGVGKSAYAFSHPSPVRFFNCDRPAASLIKKLPSHYEVHYESVDLDVDGMTPNMAARYLTAFDRMAGEAIKSGVGTFVCDGWDIFWEIVKLAKVPGLSDSTLPKEYEPANGYMIAWLRRLVQAPIPVVFTTIAEPIWSGAKTTDAEGRLKSSGFKHRGRFLTHEIYMYSPEEKDKPTERPRELLDKDKRPVGGQSHSSYIGVSKLNEKLVGRVIPNLNYGLLYRMTFGVAHPQAAELWNPAKSGE